MELGVFANE